MVGLPRRPPRSSFLGVSFLSLTCISAFPRLRPQAASFAHRTRRRHRTTDSPLSDSLAAASTAVTTTSCRTSVSVSNLLLCLCRHGDEDWKDHSGNANGCNGDSLQTVTSWDPNDNENDGNHRSSDDTLFLQNSPAETIEAHENSDDTVEKSVNVGTVATDRNTMTHGEASTALPTMIATSEEEKNQLGSDKMSLITDSQLTDSSHSHQLLQQHQSREPGRTSFLRQFLTQHTLHDIVPGENETESEIEKFSTSKANNAQEIEEEVAESEESIRWSEWMTTGRKVRSSSSIGSASSSTTVLTEAIASLDKGASSGVGGGVTTIKSSEESPTSQDESDGSKGAIVTLLRGEETRDMGGVPSMLKFLSRFKPHSKIPQSVSKKELKLRQQSEQQAKLQIDMIKKQEEERMRYRDQHRERDPGRISAVDWRHNMMNLLNSRVLRDVRNPVVWASLWATSWSVLYKSLIWIEYIVRKNTTVGCTGELSRIKAANLALGCASAMTIPTVAHSMMVSAVSLLLVFRTNSAYQRFAEGRKIWEDIVDVSRDFSRMIKLYEFAIGTSKSRRIMQLLASFPYLLRHRIRPSLLQLRRVNDPNTVRDPENSLLLYPDVSMRDTDLEVAALAYDEEETGASRRKTRELCWVDKRTLPWKLLPGTALELCARAQNRPLWVCDRMAKELSVVEDLMPKFTNRERMALMSYTDKLSRSIGACERIHQTVVPLNYARHALRILTVWLWTLPFALVKDLGLLTGPIVGVVSWILFGVYEIGTRIEDPFQGTLRLSIYCDAIRRDVLADAIVRDTAFELEESSKSLGYVDGEEDAILELESESEEYDGEQNTVQKKEPKEGGFWIF